MTHVRPFGYRVTLKLLEESDSGLIIVHDNVDDGWIKRGIVIEVGRGYQEDEEDYQELHPGNIVYFSEGYQVGDLWVVDMADIVAYEPLVDDNQEDDSKEWPSRSKR